MIVDRIEYENYDWSLVEVHYKLYKYNRSTNALNATYNFYRDCCDDDEQASIFNFL